MTLIGIIAAIIAFLGIGTLAAAVVTILLGIAGAPGSMVAGAGKNAAVRGAGLLIAVACQSYVALAFAAVIIESARPITGKTSGAWQIFLWCVAVFVASEPGAMAVKSVATKTADENPIVTRVTNQTALLTSSVNFFGSIIFAIFPSVVSWGWGWVPHL
jgi:hypothetical protein